MMSEGSIHEVISNASAVDVASLVQRLWEERGYETTLTFSGPDIHVEAVGETDEGATRTVRTWVDADGATERQLRVFVNACDRDEVEPHVVAAKTGLNSGVIPPGIATFDASGLAVELREAGVEPEDDETTEEEQETDWLGEPVDGDGDDADDDEEETEEIDRREAVKTVASYVLVGLGSYLAVERLSDYVQSSPEARAAIRRHMTDLRGRLPRMDVSFDPNVTNQTRMNEAMPSRQSASGGDRPANATRIPYHELAADTAAFSGDAVRYEGTVDSVKEREETFQIDLLVAETEADEWTDAVACRWEIGTLFDDSMSVRLLENETVTVWGVVRGKTRATRYERALPLIETLDITRTGG
ncbi:hypothetical protein ELS19_12440 [Halogeometricum borinquense]|uniref:Uncharacterized protein n=2 Tax=Halogeometricum borinquense TaxID=60847 RepID=A0A482TRV1_9EURY|nr:hypothetical protein ELS19_12440 [Halogeometricum borinquense]